MCDVIYDVDYYCAVASTMGQLLVHFVPFCPAHLLTYWHIVRYLWANKWWWWWWWYGSFI